MAKQERQWKGLAIDVNLRDEWLEALNAMKVLDPRSICEGHTREDDPLARNAHITAAFRRRQQPFFHRYWEELQGPVADLLGKCFCRDDARIEVEATRRARMEPPSWQPYFEQSIFVTATRRHARQRRGIEEETLMWLENTVAAFMQLDAGLLALYEAGEAALPRARSKTSPPRAEAVRMARPGSRPALYSSCDLSTNG